MSEEEKLNADTNAATLALGKFLSMPRQDYHFYKNNDFKSAAEAEKFLTSKEFLDYWNKNNVSKEGIGYRVKTSWNALDAMQQEHTPHKRRDYASLIAKRQATADRQIALTEANAVDSPPYQYTNSKGELVTRVKTRESRIADVKKDMTNGVNQIKNLARIENRFHTPYNSAQENLQFYLDAAKRFQSSGHIGAGEGPLPISVLMNDKMPNYSLAGYQRFDGAFPDKSVHNVMQMLDAGGGDAHLRYGTRLGATVSSNPAHEVFVPAGMAASARRTGNVLPDGTFRVVGAPSKAANAMRFASNVGAAAKPVMGVLNALAVPLQIYDQIQAVQSKDQMTRDYGGSDPLSLRPWMDLVGDASGIGGSNLSKGLKRYNTVVNDPRYIERNPISSIGGQTVRGNPEYLGAFLNNLGYYGSGSGWIK